MSFSISLPLLLILLGVAIVLFTTANTIGYVVAAAGVAWVFFAAFNAGPRRRI